MDTSNEETSFPPLQGTEMNMETAFTPKLCNFSNKLNEITDLNHLVFIFASLRFLTIRNFECPHGVNVYPLSCRHSANFTYVFFQLITLSLSLISSSYHHVNIKPKALKCSPVFSYFTLPYQRRRVILWNVCAAYDTLPLTYVNFLRSNFLACMSSQSHVALKCQKITTATTK